MSKDKTTDNFQGGTMNIDLLLEAYAQIHRYFPGAKCSLDIDDDRLLLTISAELESDAAFEILQEFDTNWWLPNLDRMQGLLGIYLELI